MWTDQRDLAYCAGLFEGEGNIQFFKQQNKLKDGSYGRSFRSLQLKIEMTDKEPLIRFGESLAIGKVSGPYIKPDNRKSTYTFSVTKFEHVQYVISSIWYWLSPRRKEQISKALKSYLSHEMIRRPYRRESNR